MSLSSSLLIGRSALTASQIALQVTGNNMANAANPAYTRQTTLMSPVRGESAGQNVFVGRGVSVSSVRRAIDPAIQARLRDGISNEGAALVDQQVLLQLESLTNELTGVDLSSELSRFFDTFSELANDPTASVTRASVVESGSTLSGFVRGLRSDMLTLRDQIDSQLSDQVERADELLNEIASLNEALVNAEQGRGEDGNLRDQRDALVDELSGLLEVTVVEQPSGAVDVLAGTQPLVTEDNARGLELRTRSTGGTLEVEVVISSTQEVASVESGSIGGLLRQRDAHVQRAIDELDEIASRLIFEVNRLHSSGRPGVGLTDTTGTLRVAAADQTVALNDPANATLSELPFAAENGSFVVVMTDQNGNRSEVRIDVDLDGIDATGAAGFGDDTSMEDIRAALDGVANLNAQITAAGELRVFTDSGHEVHFEDDTSGVLAVLGVNTYFEGEDATDIAVRGALRSDPSGLTVGLTRESNEIALAIAELREAPLEAFGGDSLGERWLKSVERTSVATAGAGTRAEALQTVRESLESQRAAVSGVSVDEESINLINYQQQYQGAARFIGVIDEMTQILLGLV